MCAPQTVGGLGAALQSYNSSSDKTSINSENTAVRRNTSVGRFRELNQIQSPFSLSRSLGPYQGTPPPSSHGQLSPAVPSRGSDPLESLPGSRGFGQSLGGMRNSTVSANIGFLVASSPPRSNNIGQKARYRHEVFSGRSKSLLPHLTPYL